MFTGLKTSRGWHGCGHPILWYVVPRCEGRYCRVPAFFWDANAPDDTTIAVCPHCLKRLRMADISTKRPGRVPS